MKKNKKLKIKFDQTKVIIVAIIVTGVIITVACVTYILKGKERPAMDYNSNSHFHIERKK